LLLRPPYLLSNFPKIPKYPWGRDQIIRCLGNEYKIIRWLYDKGAYLNKLPCHSLSAYRNKPLCQLGDETQVFVVYLTNARSFVAETTKTCHIRNESNDSKNTTVNEANDWERIWGRLSGRFRSSKHPFIEL
jgi:hypothetical protein